MVSGAKTDNAKGRDLADLLKLAPPQLAKGTHNLDLKFGSHIATSTTFTHMKLSGSQDEDDPKNQIPLIKWEAP